MTTREWIDTAIQTTLHMRLSSASYEQKAQDAEAFGQQVLEYAWDYDDHEFKETTASLSVSANAGLVEGPVDLSIEGPQGGLFISGQQWEILWRPAKTIMAMRESGQFAGNWPKFYTVFGQSANYRPYIYFDRTSHEAFTGNLYYLKTRPTIYYARVFTAPTATLVVAAGNLSAGAYTYKVTYVTSGGETDGGAASNSITVALPGTAGQIALTAIPVSLSSGVTSRKVYRTTAGGSTYKLLTTLSDNTTTTYTDNIADLSLGATIPSTDSTGEELKKFPAEYHRGLLLEGLRYMLRENVGDKERQVDNFDLFKTALARMREQRIFGLQEMGRVRGYATEGMW